MSSYDVSLTDEDNTSDFQVAFSGPKDSPYEGVNPHTHTHPPPLTHNPPIKRRIIILKITPFRLYLHAQANTIIIVSRVSGECMYFYLNNILINLHPLALLIRSFIPILMKGKFYNKFYVFLYFCIFGLLFVDFMDFDGFLWVLEGFGGLEVWGGGSWMLFIGLERFGGLWGLVERVDLYLALFGVLGLLGLYSFSFCWFIRI